MRALGHAVLGVALAGAAAMPLGAHAQSTDSTAETAKLMQTSRDWSRAAASGDAEKILAYWTDNATLILPGQPALRGAEAIRAYLARTLKAPGFHIRWEPLWGTVSGDLGYLVERTYVTANDPSGHPTTEILQSVTVWRRQPDGRWLNEVDVSTPAPPAR